MTYKQTVSLIDSKSTSNEQTDSYCLTEQGYPPTTLLKAIYLKNESKTKQRLFDKPGYRLRGVRSYISFMVGEEMERQNFWFYSVHYH